MKELERIVAETELENAVLLILEVAFFASLGVRILIMVVVLL